MDIDSKAKAMSKVSTNKLTEEASAAYNELALRKADYDGISLLYDGKLIQLHAKLFTKEKPVWEGLGIEARFIVMEIKGKLGLLYWKPEGVKAMEAMKYNSVKGGLEKELGNMKTWEVNSKEGLMELIR